MLRSEQPAWLELVPLADYDVWFKLVKVASQRCTRFSPAGAHHCASALFRLSGSRDRRAELARSFVGRFVVSWVRRSEADADGDGKKGVDTSI